MRMPDKNGSNLLEYLSSGFEQLGETAYLRSITERQNNRPEKWSNDTACHSTDRGTGRSQSRSF